MNQVQGNGKSSKQARHAHRESTAETLGSIRHRVGNARDIVENVRDQAEAAFRDRPYLVPVTACALGVGIGMLLGSRITRFLVFTAVGAMLTDLFGGELRRMGRDFVDDLQLRLTEGEEESDEIET